MIREFFGHESQEFRSRNVSSKSDLTAGYLDSKNP